MYNKSVEMLNKKVTAEFRNYETEKTKKLTFQVVGVMDADMPNNYASYAPLEVVQKMQKLMMTSEEKKQKKRNLYNQISVITGDVADTKTVLQSIKDAGYNAYSIAESLEGVEARD